MKFIMNKSNLQESTKKVYRVVPTKPSKMIMIGIKIDADKKNNSITLTGTDGDTGIIDKIKATKENGLNVSDSGSVVVVGKFFKSVVSNMPSKQITVYTTKLKSGQGIDVRMKSGRSNFKINSLFASNYPKLNVSAIHTANPITVSGADFKDIINKTAFAIPNNQAKVVLAAVHLVFDKSSMKAEATDGHRVSTYTVPAKDSLKSSVSQLVLGSTLKNIKGMFNNSDDISIYYNGTNQVIFKQNGLIVYSTTITGNYPSLSNALGVKSNYVIKTNAKMLYGLVKRASIMAHQSANDAVKFTLAADKKTTYLVVSSNAKLSGDTKESMPITVARKPANDPNFEIHLNPDYIQDALKAIGDNDLYIGFTDATRQTFWMPTKDNHKFIQIIMPIQIR